MIHAYTLGFSSFVLYLCRLVSGLSFFMNTCSWHSIRPVLKINLLIAVAKHYKMVSLYEQTALNM